MVTNECPWQLRNKQTRWGYQQKMILMNIMMQLSFNKNKSKHLWER